MIELRSGDYYTNVNCTIAFRKYFSFRCRGGLVLVHFQLKIPMRRELTHRIQILSFASETNLGRRAAKCIYAAELGPFQK